MKRLLKNEVLEKIDQEHQRLMETLAGLSEDDMLEPGVIPTPHPGQSVKDLIAHLTTWEQRMNKQVRAILHSSTLPLYPNTSDFNRKVYEINKDRTLPDVQTAFLRSYQDAVALVRQLSDAELATDGVWQLVAFNSYNHYKWANDEIKRWLGRRGNPNDQGA